jgi:hypothetical protein
MKMCALRQRTQRLTKDTERPNDTGVLVEALMFSADPFAPLPSSVSSVHLCVLESEASE